ncbi:GyrI-like domain-containing protein [Leucobacter chromiireducens]|uniref:GyrI-like domain-containing protein n=1 Tax=Leucobacter chromiireducens TaxID=283877 RepID=UPI001F1525AA|nr:GyrI-like domain-containing protein [Leucobacter chromiireducens]
MDKVNLTQELDSYAARRGAFRELTVPPMQYLMIDGAGDPNTSPAFGEAVAALYPLAYKLKFASKLELGRDYVVPPLEGLWWAEDMASFTSARDKSRWSWTLMILVPEWIGAEHVEASRQRIAAGKTPPARLADVRLAVLDEGPCVQTLHVGSFDDEADTLAHMHDTVIPGLGAQMTGTHHEIYLTDRRRTVPERMRTILRQPIAPA